MQVDPVGFFHLTYCTNIHPGESLEEIERNLHDYTRPLKSKLSPNLPFGVGLRLSDGAARELLAGDRLARFKDGLDRDGLYVFTLNGFPYGGFHRRIVKDQVYMPDWRTRERVEYTLRLIEILRVLLPDGMEGSISTSPLSYKPWLGRADQEEALRICAVHLADVAAALHTVRERTGRLLHLGIEPEPDCLLEDSRETVSFFKDRLLKRGGEHLCREHGMSTPTAETALREHIRVCYDTCHFAVEFESPDVVLSRFTREGIALSKVQISAALRVLIERDVPRHELVQALEPFAESTYLHQVVTRDGDGSLSRFRDLPDALPELRSTNAEEWRIHYHVPIFVDHFDHLHSTQPEITTALERIIAERLCPHLEIETYTWDVLPERLKTDVVTSISREYEWMTDCLAPAASS